MRRRRKCFARPSPAPRYLGLVVAVRNIGTLPGVLDKPVQLVSLPGASPCCPRCALADGTQAGRLDPGLTRPGGAALAGTGVRAVGQAPRCPSAPLEGSTRG